MKPEEMNEGVRILLGRMDTHPEEFNCGTLSKWSDIIGEIVHRAKGEPSTVPFLNDEEVQIIYDKLRDLERQEFTAQVLRRLTNDTGEGYEQLNLPYIPGIPPGQTRTITKMELELARKLGVSVEVFLESKRKNELNKIYGRFEKQVREALK